MWWSGSFFFIKKGVWIPFFLPFLMVFTYSWRDVPRDSKFPWTWHVSVNEDLSQQNLLQEPAVSITRREGAAISDPISDATWVCCHLSAALIQDWGYSDSSSVWLAILSLHIFVEILSDTILEMLACQYLLTDWETMGQALTFKLWSDQKEWNIVWEIGMITNNAMLNERMRQSVRPCLAVI